MSTKAQTLNLPEFVKAQIEVINGPQKRVNQLNKDFEIEKACKNPVYFFILENGYFDEYVKYSKINPVQYQIFLTSTIKVGVLFL